MQEHTLSIYKYVSGHAHYIVSLVTFMTCDSTFLQSHFWQKHRTTSFDGSLLPWVLSKAFGIDLTCWSICLSRLTKDKLLISTPKMFHILIVNKRFTDSLCFKRPCVKNKVKQTLSSRVALFDSTYTAPENIWHQIWGFKRDINSNSTGDKCYYWWHQCRRRITACRASESDALRPYIWDCV